AHLRRGLDAAARMSEPDRRAEMQMLLNLELGVPMIATRGYAAPETMEAWETARTLAEGRDARQLVRALYGLWAARISLGETRTALDLATRLVRLGEQMQDDGVRIVGHRVRGLTHQTLGELEPARSELEQALALYDPARHRLLGLQFGQNPRVAAMAILSVVLWLQGFPDRARATSLAALEEASALNHANSISYVLAYGACPVALLRCDLAETERLADQLVAFAEERHFELWRAYGWSYKAWALTQRGDAEQAVTLLRNALAAFERAGSALYAPVTLGLLGYALGRAGQAEEGRATLVRAVAEAERRDEVWCLPELVRQHAALLRRAGSATAADGLLKRAAAIARRADLRGPELRCTAGIAARLREQHRDAEAATLLTPLIDRFSEGWDTADLKWAMAIAGRSRIKAAAELATLEPP
ncbi:MAG: hypothetical protein ACREF3_17155, partial [Acetobacteraceae bacterium]